jgi:hypothetical protein
MVALFINSKITFNDIDTFKRKRKLYKKLSSPNQGKCNLSSINQNKKGVSIQYKEVLLF